MSSLTYKEKTNLEKLFDMGGGYVSNFSDSTIARFFSDTVDVDIHAEKYQSIGTSKAKKLREFWRLESDHLVGKAIAALIDHVEEAYSLREEQKKLLEPCKAIANRLLSGSVHLEHLKEAVTFDARYLAEQIRRMQESVHSDPSLAIGTAKELIETCCKTILAQRGITLPGKPEIPELTRATLKELKLVPDAIEDSARGSDVLKRLLQNLGTIGHNLAELRGLYGTGHGKHAHSETLTPRHAKLAVGSAATLATFLFDTHRETFGTT
ncbi:MAG: abortive infection family protein [Nitrospira sp.]|nr:abortive infection family protein [Nitrospira sp.]